MDNKQEIIARIRRMYDLSGAITLFLRKNLQTGPEEVFFMNMKYLLLCEIGALGRQCVDFFREQTDEVTAQIKQAYYPHNRPFFTKLRRKLKRLALKLYLEKAK